MTAEIWKPVPGYERYEASNLGQVRSVARLTSNGRRRQTHILKPYTLSNGYMQVGIYAQPDRKRGMCVHRLVLMAFKGMPGEGLEGCHNDGNPANNRLENLRWDTRSANMADKLRHGRNHHANKTHCPRDHAYDDLNTIRDRTGRKRTCRTCKNFRRRELYVRKADRS